MSAVRRHLNYLGLAAIALSTAACNGRSLQDALQADPNLQPDAAEVAASGCDDVTRSRLPNAFPDSFCYPNADLLKVSETTLDEGADIEARWSTADEAEQVGRFYRDALEQENWEITNPAAAEADPIEAVKDGVRVAIALGAGQADAATQFTVRYRPTQAAQADDTSNTQDAADTPRAGDDALSSTASADSPR
ncbi:MAG: hypothetical protein WBA10_09805, partial [Elainellaceae cyanobacterium]